jgi:hypothetical protein
MKTVKTPKGTELPLTDIKGKDYLNIPYRITWFREEKPSWGIETEFIMQNEKLAIAKATIKDEAGRIVSQAHKHETVEGFSDHREKAETGAIGRALANLGYGTQFALDLDEGVRLADSPLDYKKPPAQQQGMIPPTVIPNRAPGADVSHQDDDYDAHFESYIVKFGKYKGKDLKSVDPQELVSYRNYLVKNAKVDGKELKGPAAEFVDEVGRRYGSGKNEALGGKSLVDAVFHVPMPTDNDVPF